MQPNDSSQPLTDRLYALQGKTLSFESEPKTVYLGMPTLCADGKDTHTPLLVKLSEATTWQPLTSQTQGIYQIAGQNLAGATVFQQCCALLPENFAICVHHEQRSIDVMHSGRAYISCDSPLVSHIGIVADGRSIEFNTSEPLPDTVELIFRWSGIPERLTIYVPFALPIIKTSIKTISDVKTLTEARAIENAQLRNLFTRHLLKQLSRQFAVEEWQALLNLPLTDKEFWDIVKQEPRVLVALLFHLNITTLAQLTETFSICWYLIPIRDWLAVFTRYQNHLAIVLTETMVKVQLNKHIEKLHLLAPCLNVVEQLLKSWLFNVVDDELLFMQSEEASLLISEQLQDEQQQLLARHTEQPDLKLLLTELHKDWQHLPKETQQLLPLGESQQAVLLLPLISVQFVLTAQASTWQTDTAAITELKTFDDLWFNTAYTLLLTYLSQQPFYASLLKQETIAMTDHDENDLVAEIEQQLALTNQEVQGLETDIQNLAGGQEALEALLVENQQLNAEIENLSNIIKKRDAALRLLLDEVKKLNAKIRDIRAELQVKA